MRKFWIQITILLIVSLGALYLSYHLDLVEPFLPVKPKISETKIKVGEVVLKIEVADSASKRSKGLSGRESLASDSGMLFIFPQEKKYQFWMKGMKFPLDFIFIRGGKVVDLLRSIPTPSPAQQDQSLPLYEPVVPINMMLEVNSGFIDARQIQIGETVYLIK